MGASRMRCFPRFVAALVVFASIQFAPLAVAHPLLEDAVDVVISPDHITLEARVAVEEILLAEAAGASKVSPEQWPMLLEKHRLYLPRHFRVKADGVALNADTVNLLDPSRIIGKAPSPSTLIGYSIRYPTARRPTTIQIDQSILRELNSWSVTCVLRIRQVDEDTFQSMLLTTD